MFQETIKQKKWSTASLGTCLLETWKDVKTFDKQI